MNLLLFHLKLHESRDSADSGVLFLTSLLSWPISFSSRCRSKSRRAECWPSMVEKRDIGSQVFFGIKAVSYQRVA